MPRGIILVPVTILLLSALLLSCGGSGEDVVARVGDKEITLGDFNVTYKSITIFNRPPLVTYDDCESFLNTLINKNIMVDEALARGLDKNEELETEIAQERLQRLIRALYNEIADAEMDITLAEVEDYYRRSRMVLMVRQIVVATLAEAEEIAGRLAAGEDFAKLASMHSLDVQSATSGGEMGEIRHGLLPANMERAVFSLEVGELSEPVQTGRGYHLLEVTERIDTDMSRFEEERHNCAAELRSRRRNENWGGFMENQKAAQAIEFNEENVDWLNSLLPNRGSMDQSWVGKISEEDRSKQLCTSAVGAWTIGDFVDEYGQRKGPQPYNAEGAALIRGSLEAKILNKANHEEALRRGLDKSDMVIRAVRKKMEEKLLDYFYDDLTGDVTAPEERLLEVYEEQKENLIMPERVKLQLISVENRERADEILAKLKAGASFDDLASKHNLGVLQENAGVLPLMTRERTPNELHSYAFGRLKIGEITPVVPSEVAVYFYIAKLLEKSPEHPMSYEEAKEDLAATLNQVARDEVLSRWLEQRREDLGVTIYPEVLNILIEEEGGEVGAETS